MGGGAIDARSAEVAASVCTVGGAMSASNAEATKSVHTIDDTKAARSAGNCRGASICPHGRQRSTCKEHYRNRYLLATVLTEFLFTSRRLDSQS